MSFDKLAAIYVFCANYHSGQWSRLYRLMCRISATLSDNAWEAIQDGTGRAAEDWEDAREVYLTLVANYEAGRYHA